MSDASPTKTACHVCANLADEVCVRCRRGLCAAHRVRRSGISLYVFGPLFDDGAIRCDDCYSARFWRATIALTAIIGTVVALLSLAKGEFVGAMAGAGLAIIGAGFSFWRAATFDRRAGIEPRAPDRS